MKHPEENIVSYSAEELEHLPRLDGARRPHERRGNHQGHS